MSIKERAELFCEHKEISLAAFCRTSNVSNGYFTNLKGEVGYRICKKIAKTYPELNLDWLQTGEGEMLNSATPILPIEVNIDTGTVSEKPVEPIPDTAEVIPIVPSEITSDRDINIREYVEHNIDELEHVDAAKMFKRADFVEEVSGTSMWPTFVPGDWVFIRYLPDRSHIIDGKTYYLDTKILPTMVRKVKFEGNDRLRLIAKNPQFADIIISRADVNNIGKVVSMFRQSFADQYDEIENVRRQKDKQIDSMLKQSNDLIEQNGQALKIIQDLIKK